MKNKLGKLFQSDQTREIISVSYLPSDNYYYIIKKAQEDGYHQIIVTSDIMIKILEHFLYNHNAIINNIEFMIEDINLKEQVDILIEKMAENNIFWEKLKSHLIFLSNDSIDIKRIDLKCANFLFSVLVNGVFTVSENTYSKVVEEVTKLIGDILNE